MTTLFIHFYFMCNIVCLNVHLCTEHTKCLQTPPEVSDPLELGLLEEAAMWVPRIKVRSSGRAAEPSLRPYDYYFSHMFGFLPSL